MMTIRYCEVTNQDYLLRTTYYKQPNSVSDSQDNIRIEIRFGIHCSLTLSRGFRMASDVYLVRMAWQHVTDPNGAIRFSTVSGTNQTYL